MLKKTIGFIVCSANAAAAALTAYFQLIFANRLNAIILNIHYIYYYYVSSIINF